MTALTDSHIFVGNNSNIATDVPMSGDATIDDTGAVTVTSVRALADDFSTTQTTHTDGTEDLLFSYTLPANTLAHNGDKLRMRFAGNFIPGATKDLAIDVHFPDGVDSLLGNNPTSYTADYTGYVYYEVEINLMRISSTSCVWSGVLRTNDINNPLFLMNAVETDNDFTTNQDIGFYGSASGAGAAAGDVKLVMASVEYIRHA
jgi:hypothetical protein